MKGYDRSKESSYMQYFDVNNLYGWAISQKLPVNNFEWIKDTFQFNWRFHKKNIMKNVMKLMFNILKNYMNSIMI